MDRIEEYIKKLDNFDKEHCSFLEHVKQLAHNYEDEKLLTFLTHYQNLEEEN